MLAQKIAQAGTAPAFAAPLATDTAPYGSVLVVKNASAAAVTVTLVTPGNLPTGDTYPDKAYTVAAGAELWVRLDQAAYRSVVDSAVVDVTFSAVASVTAAAIEL